MRSWTTIRLAFSVFAAPFLVIAYLNIEKWAEANGIDTLLLDAVQPDGRQEVTTAATLLTYVTQPWVAWLSIYIVGIVSGIWLDVLIRREWISTEEKRKAIGKRCAYLVAHISSIRRTETLSNSSLRTRSALNSIWSEYLPTAYNLEKMGLPTPDIEIKTDDDAIFIREYLRFVGPLIESGHAREARKVARRLCSSQEQPQQTNHQTNRHSYTRRIRGIAQKKRLKNPLG
tara:strand:+ start:237 stop:926 length:690 start_codon:yes stop_codon:yes gene_type:complete